MIAEEEEDVVLGNAVADVHLYDYHIAYHPSYSVPILLFRGRSRTGEMLEIKDIVNSCQHVSIICRVHSN